MNIAFYLTPKMNVTTLLDTCSLDQGLDELRRQGYSAVPVVTAENQYVGTVSESDILRYLLAHRETADRSLADTPIAAVMRPDGNPAVRITADMEDLFSHVLNQSFVPVVDDLGSFVGIVTRMVVIQHLYSAISEGGGDRREEP